MPALLAVISGDANPLKRELYEVDRMANQTGRNMERGILNGAGAIARSGVMRELVVLMREISRGNWSRVPGSLSILIDRLGFLKYIFSAVGGVTIAAGVAAYYFWQHLKKVNEELDNTGNIFSRSWGHMADSMQKAMNEGAVAAADFNGWLIKIGESQETLADKTADTIRAMREEAQLRQEAYGEKDPAKRRAAEQAERKKELDVLNKSVAQQRDIEAKAIASAMRADQKAFSGDDAIKRRGKMDNLPTEIESSKKSIAFYEEAVKQLQPHLDHANRPTGFWNGQRDQWQIDRDKHEAVTKNFSVKIDGKDYQLNLDDATEQLKKSRESLASMNAQQTRLAVIQKELADIAKDTKGDSEKQKHARETLTRERDNLRQSIQLHERYDPMIKSNAGRQHGHVSGLQAVGAYTTAHIDVEQRQLTVLHTIARNTAHKAKRGGIDSSRVNYGDIPNMV